MHFDIAHAAVAAVLRYLITQLLDLDSLCGDGSLQLLYLLLEHQNDRDERFFVKFLKLAAIKAQLRCHSELNIPKAC